MATTLITAPARLPVTLNDVKDHLRISGTDNDGFLSHLLLAATNLAETFMNRRIVRQTTKLFLNDWPAGDTLCLPFGQLKSVTHVKYFDTDDTEYTFSTGDYSVDTDSEPGRIVLDYGDVWPTETLRTNNPIEIQFVSGYFAGPYWTVATTFAEDDYIEPTNANSNGLVYQAGGAGAGSATTEPTWPGTVDGTVVDNAVTWSCVGQGVPRTIRQAIMLQVTDLYKIREPYLIGVVHKPLRTVQALLWPYRVFGGAS